MNVFYIEPDLRTQIVKWSDSHLLDARHQIAANKDLLSKSDLTNSQFHGLMNFVRNAKSFNDIASFIQNQGAKAERAGKYRLNEFWTILNKRLSTYRSDAQAILRAANSSWANDNQRIDSIHRQLVIKFVQHLIAEMSIHASRRK